MMILNYIFGIIFCIINIYILYNDIWKKRVPNIGVFSLLVLSVIGYVFLPMFTISWTLGGTVCIALLVCFLLFYYGVWGAGDAKYLFSLSLYIPSGGIIFTFGNIGLITIIYLTFHMLYLYVFQALIFPKKYGELYKSIFYDLREKLLVSLHKSQVSLSFFGILSWLLPIIFSFLFIFTILRLGRIYLFNIFIAGQNTEGNLSRGKYITDLMQDYGVYIVIAFIISLVLIYKYTKKYLKFLILYLIEKTGFSQEKIKYISLIIGSSMLFIFISYEYSHHPKIISESLIRIFTFLIFLWLLIKIIIYMYYVTFQLNEVVYKPISDLKTGDVVDIEFLVSVFGTQKILGHAEKQGKYSPNPKKFLYDIENPISSSLCKELKTIYTRVNNYHKKQKTPGFEKIEAIKIFKTLAFSPYIFGGVVISIIYQDTLLNSIFIFIWERLSSI